MGLYDPAPQMRGSDSKNQKHRSLHAVAVEDAELSIAPRSEDKVTIDQAFDHLSDDHRTAALLYFGEGLTIKEIAEVTGTAIGTAKSRLFHARQQLKAALNDESNEGET